MKKLNAFTKKSGFFYGLIVIAVCCMLTLSFTGCDDDDSYEARLEDARIALDEGNYALAESILSGLPDTAEVLQYRSNAISGGELNLDTFTIISTMADLEDTGDSGSIDMIGTIIGGGDDQLTPQEIDDKLAAANEAIDLFKDIAAAQNTGVDGLTDDQKMQLGLLAITRTTLTLASLISQELPEGEPVIMTEAWIEANRADFPSLNPSPEDLTRINEDLQYTEYAIDVIADTNDIKDDYQEFKNDLSADNNITTEELNAFIAGMGEGGA